jgi:hypothetical protein
VDNLVQRSFGCKRCAQRDLQGEHQDSVYVIVRKEEGFS